MTAGTAASTGNFFSDLSNLLAGTAKPTKPASRHLVRVPGFGKPKKRVARVLSLRGQGLAMPGGFGGATSAETPDESTRTRRDGGYRTMCVRLCDGYYWPVSNAAYSSDFSADRRECETSCVVPAKLYYQTDGGENPARMRGLDGKTYDKLKTAFAYRKSLVPSCRCKADPWADSEMLRHRNYALLPKPNVTIAAGPSHSDRAIAASLSMFDDAADAIDIGGDIAGDSGLPENK